MIMNKTILFSWFCGVILSARPSRGYLYPCSPGIKRIVLLSPPKKQKQKQNKNNNNKLNCTSFFLEIIICSLVPLHFKRIGTFVACYREPVWNRCESIGRTLCTVRLEVYRYAFGLNTWNDICMQEDNRPIANTCYDISKHILFHFFFHIHYICIFFFFF